MPPSLPVKKKPASPVKKQAGPAKKPAGPAKKPAGPAKKPAGTVRKPAGPAKKPAGPAKKPAGPLKKPTGPVKKPAGPAKKQAGPAKKPAGPAKKTAVPVKKQAGPAKQVQKQPGAFVKHSQVTSRYRSGQDTEKIIKIEFNRPGELGANNTIKFKIEEEVDGIDDEREVPFVYYKAEIGQSEMNERPTNLDDTARLILSLLLNPGEEYDITWPERRTHETFTVDRGETPVSLHSYLYNIDIDILRNPDKIILELSKSTKWEGDGYSTE